MSEQLHLELVMQSQLASVLFRFRPESDDETTVALLKQSIGDALLASGSANAGVTEADGVNLPKTNLAESCRLPWQALKSCWKV